jgi:hypothetical protein
MAFNHVGDCSCPVGSCDCGPERVYTHEVEYNNGNYNWMRCKMSFTNYRQAAYFLWQNYEQSPKTCPKPKLKRVKS